MVNWIIADKYTYHAQSTFLLSSVVKKVKKTCVPIYLGWEKIHSPVPNGSLECVCGGARTKGLTNYLQGISYLKRIQVLVKIDTLGRNPFLPSSQSQH